VPGVSGLTKRTGFPLQNIAGLRFRAAMILSIIADAALMVVFPAFVYEFLDISSSAKRSSYHLTCCIDLAIAS
jgi:hypothetical protein